MKRLLIPFAAALLAAASGTSALSVSQAKAAAAEAQAKAKVVHDSLARVAAEMSAHPEADVVSGHGYFASEDGALGMPTYSSSGYDWASAPDIWFDAAPVDRKSVV